MVKPLQVEKEISKELSATLRSIRFTYKNQVKLQLVNVKNLNELKLSVLQGSYPYTRWLFLVKIPKQYPADSLWLEPIQISDEMRKHFNQDKFKFNNVKLLVESVLNFCKKFDNKTSKNCKINYPTLNGFGLKSSPFNSRSTNFRDTSRTRLPKALGYSRRRALTKFLESLQTTTVKLLKPQVKGRTRGMYTKPMFKTIIHPHKSSENLIRCLELQCHIKGSTEYILLPDNEGMENLSKNRSIMSSLVHRIQTLNEKEEDVESVRLIQKSATPKLLNLSDQHLNYFSEDCRNLYIEVLCSQSIDAIDNEGTGIVDDNIDVNDIDLNNKFCHKNKDDSTITSFSEVRIWPNYFWTCSGKSDSQLGTPLFPQTEDNLSYSAGDYYLYEPETTFKIAEVLYDYGIEEYDIGEDLDDGNKNEEVSVNDSMRGDMIVKEERMNVLEKCMTKTECSMDTLQGIQLLLLINANIDLTTKQSQKIIINSSEFQQSDNQHQLSLNPLHPDQGKVIDDSVYSESLKIRLPPFTESQVLLTAGPGKIVTQSKKQMIQQLCSQLIQPPNSVDQHLIREISFTLDINLESPQECSIIDYFNIPLSLISSTQSPIIFLAPDNINSISSMPLELFHILILDRTDSLTKKGKERFIKLHRIKTDSIVYNYFLEQCRYQTNIGTINKQLFFGNSIDNMLWPIKLFQNYLSLITSNSQIRRLRQFLLDYLSLAQFNICYCQFHQSTIDILNNLQKTLPQSNHRKRITNH